MSIKAGSLFSTSKYPLSALLFALSVEIMALNLRSSKDIKGIAVKLDEKTTVLKFLSLFNFFSFHVFHIFSLFNLLFFHIFPIFFYNVKLKFRMSIKAGSLFSKYDQINDYPSSSLDIPPGLTEFYFLFF
jgi:hypothetical protein